MKKILLILFVIILTGFFSGCIVKEKTFSHRGLSVTLKSDFKEYDHKEWELYLYNDQQVAFMMNKISKKSSLEGLKLSELSLSQYMSLYTYLYDVKDRKSYKVEAVNVTFEYCYFTSGEQYGYMFIVLEDEDYFYNINLSTPYETFENSKEMLFEYAITLKLE